jgi:MFS family permease
VLLATTLAAFLMYVDRACLAWTIKSGSFEKQVQITPDQVEWLKSAFFWAYALAQVPAGWLAERFGVRALMTIYIATWSAFTAMTGFATGFTSLVVARFGCGLAEAGAYPASSSLLKRWAHFQWRGVASSVVSLGGRIGFALAPTLTATIIAWAADWRWAGWIYGAAGVATAAIFWRVFRETPAENPNCNEAERALLAEGNVESEVRRAPAPFPWRPVLTSRTLWCMCCVQLASNVGWAFLINSLADFLKHAKHLDDRANGLASTLALALGLAGLPLGGLLTDLCTRKLGLRLGRLIPLAATRFMAAGAYLAALCFDSPWAVAAAFGLVAFSTDMGLPATWACMQDIGGRHTAPIFGWANMWGNFGAALQPVMMAWVLRTFDGNHDWRAGLLFSCGAFVVSGVCAFGINAAAQVAPEENEMASKHA